MSTVLIVEDEPIISRMYKKIITSAGYTVETAQDGETGLAAVKAAHPDLILLDFMMPKLNGLQVLEKLKADPETAKIPVVMLSNLTASSETELSLKKGAAKYVIKSELEPKQIIELVHEFFPAQAGSPSNAPTDPSSTS